MATAKYTRTEKVVKEASEFMAGQAKIELGAKRTRVAIRASWRKTGNRWQPVMVSKQRIRKNFTASGNLVRSIRSTATGTQISLSMDWYAEAIIQGRKPWDKAKFSGRRGIPLDSISRWARVRRLRPKNPATGEFIANTQANRSAALFMMNRKIKYFGIEPFDFMKIAQESTVHKYEKQITAALKLDIIDILGTKFKVNT